MLIKIVILALIIMGINFYAFSGHQDFVTWIIIQFVITVGGLILIIKSEE